MCTPEPADSLGGFSELDAVGGTSGVADVKLHSVYPLLTEVVLFD